MIYIFLLLVLYYWIISESSIKYNVYSAILLCYNRFVTKKYKKRKPTDIIRFVKNKRKK